MLEKKIKEVLLKDESIKLENENNRILFVGQCGSGKTYRMLQILKDKSNRVFCVMTD